MLQFIIIKEFKTYTLFEVMMVLTMPNVNVLKMVLQDKEKALID